MAGIATNRFLRVDLAKKFRSVSSVRCRVGKCQAMHEVQDPGCQ